MRALPCPTIPRPSLADGEVLRGGTRRGTIPRLPPLGAGEVMATVALGVAILSLVVAAVSLYLSFRESERRDIELELQQGQAKAAEADRARKLRAWVEIAGSVPILSSERGIEYTLPLQNSGEFKAVGVKLELLGTAGPVATSELPGALLPGGQAEVKITTPARDRYSGPYQVIIEWLDGLGMHREATPTIVALP